LISHMAIATSGYTSRSGITAGLTTGGNLLNPVRSLSSVFAPLLSRVSAATPVTSANTYCGNVQFGYTAAEKKLMDTDPSYKPLENQLILDENTGIEDQIDAKYKQCFDGSMKIGDMLANGLIRRDQTGNVIANDKDALCSPNNLSYDSPDPLGNDISSDSPNNHDLIFRYRLAHNYNNTLDQLTSEQTVSN